jgi:hypothetical protein
MNKKKAITAIGRAHRPLAAGLALAFAASGVALPTHATATTHVVTNCNDGDFGSLRFTINAVTTLSGDTIDLSQPLPCSSITLTTGAIIVTQNDLTLIGPGADALAIDGGKVDRVIIHEGIGTLAINYLTITNGKYTTSSYAFGGCIDSFGNIALVNSRVSNCAANAQGIGIAYGGGIFTIGNVSMIGSTVSDNSASAQGPYKTSGGGISTIGGLSMISSTITGNSVTSMADADGGGAYAYGNFSADLSTISDNSAHSTISHAYGGGLVTGFNATVTQSTISGNRAASAAAWLAFNSQSPHGAPTIAVINSTISGNVAEHTFGGIFTRYPLALTNSTIAFNKAGDSSSAGAGLYSAAGLYATGAPLTLESSIIANNIISSTGAPSDLGGPPTGTPITGHNNLITSGIAVVFPLGTLTACPKLGPLADNGGLTLTHALLSTSPAIDTGNNSGGNFDDQRGTGYPRPFGAAADIGAYEWQGTLDDRIFVSRMESSCDS